jgi:hypothetical protein
MVLKNIENHPDHRPHYVKTFDEPSVSLSVTWRTPSSEAARHLRAAVVG